MSSTLVFRFPEHDRCPPGHYRGTTVWTISLIDGYGVSELDPGLSRRYAGGKINRETLNPGQEIYSETACDLQAVHMLTRSIIPRRADGRRWQGRLPGF